MEMTPVKSSNIIAIGYDAEKREIHVQFRSGTYKYHDAPPEVHQALMNAESKGKHVQQNIVGKFRHTKLPT